MSGEVDAGGGEGGTTMAEVTVLGEASTEKEAVELLRLVLEGTHVLADAAEAAEILGLGRTFPVLVPSLEAAGPVGWVATLGLMAWETAEAFNTRNTIDLNMGQCYGALCAAEEVSDPEPPPLDQGGLGVDANRTYWHDGLANGRLKMADSATRNKVLLSCAKQGETAVLNSLWQAVCDGRHPESFFVLSWPTAGISGTNMG